MNKLEVGMWVRTKNGYITKICNINDYGVPSMKYGIEANYLPGICFIGDEDIKKASFDIIDLIEVGDYVNGFKVDEVVNRDDFKCVIYYYPYDEEYCEENEIKSILTHEQMENMEYEVE